MIKLNFDILKIDESTRAHGWRGKLNHHLRPLTLTRNLWNRKWEEAWTAKELVQWERIIRSCQDVLWRKKLHLNQVSKYHWRPHRVSSQAGSSFHRKASKNVLQNPGEPSPLIIQSIPLWNIWTKTKWLRHLNHSNISYWITG